MHTLQNELEFKYIVELDNPTLTKSGNTVKNLRTSSALDVMRFVADLPKRTRGTVKGVLSNPLTISAYRIFMGL